ncbi:hypothetical protein [Limisphaera sp. 4302-co]|uniref:hypothetical protein n=1 Tax=Limisphaera sp. 4302-co TaxID=3400417 RepID=UPI003C13F3B5
MGSRTKSKTIYLRVTGTMKERVEYAQKLGISPNEFVNALIREFGRTWLERQAPERLQQLRELVNAPVP